MQIVGICRFSLLGRGDWAAFRTIPPDKADENAEAVEARKASIFAPERLERRFTTFEHLTLASIRAQTDPDFTFVVLASELMPQRYRDRLAALCAAVPQVVLRFFPVIHAGTAQGQVFKELGIDYRQTLQFRLDDDDALCNLYIRRMRQAAGGIVPNAFPFAASFRDVLFCSVGGDHAGVYQWRSPFFSAGVALFHPSASIFGFGHYGMAERFTSISIPGHMSLVTHNGMNDTTLDEGRIRRQKMNLIDDEAATKAVERHFPYLTPEARAVAGLPV
ncbi:glycosyltransferase [Paracoccus yeei]|uniref:glycosyltransferase n=1 Tax=Paracoccus yeei TaxID=147645 RepID=UPI001C8D1A2D|nr:glycosyltransferase [Paracoccus yeei]MBY0137051.1 hypothetical protein [Paracoccus yeei]